MSILIEPRFIWSHSFASENIWGSYHKGVICGLTNDFVQQDKYFQKLLKEDHSVEWLNELKNKVTFLIENSNNKNRFKETILEIIKKTKALKKLVETDIKFDE